MSHPVLRLGSNKLPLDTPRIMGIVNVTPDSFSDGGQYDGRDKAVGHALSMQAEGADIIDVGGESTRPGAEPVTVSDELLRVIPVIEALKASALEIPISVDTRRAIVAKAALKAGATMVNDVSALADPEMPRTVADAGAALVLMHMRGDPATMQLGKISYDNVTEEVRHFLRRSAKRALAAGVEATQILLDPGIGFGKTQAHNLQLTRELRRLGALGYPIVFGPSRKRFLGEITHRPPQERDVATAAVCALAWGFGARLFRVHRIDHVKDALAVAAALVTHPHEAQQAQPA